MKKIDNYERAKEIGLDFDQDMTARLIAQAYENAVWEDNVINGTTNTDQYYFKKAIQYQVPLHFSESMIDDFVRDISTIDELIKKVNELK
tara:strand:- start:98 stop:367 length:270 start_codon:yes stop_codon:yes gene_type:complete